MISSPMKITQVKNVGAPVADAILLDGASLVQMLNPGASRIFQECGQKVFVPYIYALLEQSSHINLIWYVYLPAA